MREEPPHPMKLLSMKELADALGRSPKYVQYMRRRGFKIIAGRATLSSAIVFLQKCDQPCKR
jgi:DNA-binding CsgD family transcriptional regulator